MRCAWSSYNVLADGTPIGDAGMLATQDDIQERVARVGVFLESLSYNLDAVFKFASDDTAGGVSQREDAAERFAVWQEAHNAIKSRLDAVSVWWPGANISWADEVATVADLGDQVLCLLHSMREPMQTYGLGITLPFDPSADPPTPPASIGEGLAEVGRGLGAGLIFLGLLWLWGRK